MSADISPLSEEDIPGASLRGRDPQQLTIPELKRIEPHIKMAK